MTNFTTKDFTKRQLIYKYMLKRIQYKSIIKNQTVNKEIRYKYINMLNTLNRNSCETRYKNRCVLTGRSRAVFKLFKLSRIKFRELASQGMLPGVTKASWQQLFHYI